MECPYFLSEKQTDIQRIPASPVQTYQPTSAGRTAGLGGAVPRPRRTVHLTTGRPSCADPHPQIGRVQDTEYTATSDFKSTITGGYQDMYIEQDGFNSIVGELGVGLGKRFEKGTVYTKLAVAHEFAGDFASSYMDENSNIVKSEVDLGGSWFEWQIGV